MWHKIAQRDQKERDMNHRHIVRKFKVNKIDPGDREKETNSHEPLKKQ